MGEVGYNLPVSNKQNYYKEKETFLVRLVLRTGIVKNKKQTNVVLLIITGMFFLLTAGIFLSEDIKTKNNDTINIPSDIPY